MKTYAFPLDPVWEDRDPSPVPAPPQAERHREGETAPVVADVPLALRSRALDFLTEGVVVIDLAQPHHPMIYVNPAFEQLTGYTAAELVGRPYDVLEGPHPDPDRFAPIRAALRDRRAWSGEVRVARKDGASTYQELRLTPFPDDAGQVRYALGIQADLSEWKDLQEGLRQAQKMAAIGWLAGGLAHNFNNLLTPILGYCDLLLTETSTVSLRAGLEEIRKAGQVGATLIGQLLALCRKQQLPPRVLDLRTILANIQGLIRCVLPRNVELVTTVDPALGLIQAGPGQVEQILLNLIRNACDAMPHGGRITVALSNVENSVAAGSAVADIPPGPYVLLTVTDTGCGMSEEVRAGLFQPSFTTKDFGKGNGLGLFMVHGIVTQNHGLIHVTSQPGQGTCVAIYWPRVSSAVACEEPAQAAPAQPLGGETILLAADEPGIRDIISWVLRQQGYTVLEAGHHQEEAVRIAREHPEPIHLLLIDTLMPSMDAQELVAQLVSWRPGMKVLSLSGYGAPTDGAVLLKPFTPEELIRKVQALLR